MEWTCVLVLFLSLQLHLTPCTEAAFNVSLELQGDCSDQLTLICRHSDDGNNPLWIHNGTAENGVVLFTAFPGAVYTVQNLTEHTATITGVDSVRALDGHIIQCGYIILGILVKSNAVKYSFIPPDYRPALSLVSFTSNFSELLSIFNYSFQNSCSLYPRCTQHFSVEHTVSPQSAVSISSSGCSVEYAIHNMMRCVSYQSTATALLRSQRGNPVVVGSTVMQSPGQFTITSVSIEEDRNLINVTYMENESDCPNNPTERYTVDVAGVQVADLTADEFQSKITDLSNRFLTLSLPLSQPLPENALTLNMTKYNTVPTNRSDVTGNIVTEMVTWGTSAVFTLQESPPGREPQAPVNNDAIVIGVSVSVGIALVILGGGGGTTVIVVVVKCRHKNKKTACIRCLQACIWCLQACIWCLEACILCLLCLPCLLMWKQCKKKKKKEEHKWGKGAGRHLPMAPEEEQGVIITIEMEAGRHATERQLYAELDFAEEHPIPPPPSEMFVVAYAEVAQA